MAITTKCALKKNLRPINHKHKMSKTTLKKTLLFLLLTTAFIACQGDMEPTYQQQEVGKVVIRGYALNDSVQVEANKFLEINDKDTFIGSINMDYDFVYYDQQDETINVLDKKSGSTLHTNVFTTEKVTDTLSFFYTSDYYIDNVLSYKPGTLSQTGYAGFRFIFPTYNRYSNSGYTGMLDGIIRKVNGEQLAVAQNISQDSASDFVEFPYGAPPVLKMELVKHGTTESYVSGKQVFVSLVMQANKSQVVVLDEKKDENGAFSGVNGSINLTDYFEY
jgi:hypothetical protein